MAYGQFAEQFRVRLRTEDGSCDFAVPLRDLASIGRNDDCYFVVTDPSISGRHAQVRLSEGRVLLADLHSTNGTYVNNAKLSQGEVELYDEDVVQIGPLTLHVHIINDGFETPDNSEWDSGATHPYNNDEITTDAPIQTAANSRPRSPTRPHSRQDTAVAVGTVHAPSWRSQQSSIPSLSGFMVQEHVFTFTLLAYDEQGYSTGSIGIEMIGEAFTGVAPVEDDRVEVRGHPDRQGFWRAQDIRNIVTNSSLTTTAKSSFQLRRIAYRFTIIIACIGIIAGGFFVLDQTGYNPIAAKVTVPEVESGEPLSVVDSRLREAGLGSEWIDISDQTVKFGSVVRISPASGSSVRRHSKVNIYINVSPPG